MAEGNNNEAMIQLPWTVPQQPLYTTHVSVDPESKKIPIDLNVSSTDWGVVGSVLLSFLAFAVTIYVVKQSTKSQIETNKALIESQEMVKQRDIEASYIRDWKNNIIHRSAEILVGQNDFILVLRKFIKLNLQPTQFEKDIALFKQNYENLEVIAKKILSTHHILMLNFDLRTQSKKVEQLDLMFCKIMWICLQKIENKEDLIFSTTEITILKDEIQKHNLDVKIDNYKNLTSDPFYHLLVEIHGKFQHEVRKLIN